MSTNQSTPVIPERVRTALYIIGTVLGLGATPALVAVELTELAAVTGALAGACNALAFGYRPTRATGTDG